MINKSVSSMNSSSKNKGEQAMSNKSISEITNNYNLLKDPAKLEYLLTRLENAEGRYLVNDTHLSFFQLVYSDFRSAMEDACDLLPAETAALLPESFRGTRSRRSKESEAEIAESFLKDMRKYDQTVADVDFHCSDSAAISLETGDLIISYTSTPVYTITYTEESGKKPEIRSSTSTHKSIIRRLTSQGVSQYKNLDTLETIYRKHPGSKFEDGFERKQIFEKEYLPAFNDLWNDPNCTESIGNILSNSLH